MLQKAAAVAAPTANKIKKKIKKEAFAYCDESLVLSNE
jgi:hypothetical protein